MTRTAALSVLLALVSNLAASRRGNEHVVTLDFAVVVCLSAEESLHKEVGDKEMRDSRNL